MQVLDFILKTYLDSFLKTAKVNLQTGEYHFLKEMPIERTLGCLDTPDIEAYAHSIVDNALLYPADNDSYLFHTALSYLRKMVKRKKHNLTHSFRRKTDSGYIWITFEITVPQDYSDENPWVVFSWKRADSDTCALEDSLRILSNIYHKIMKINLTDDSYEIIKVYDAELNSSHGFSSKASLWIRQFALSGNVYPDDIPEYLTFTDSKRLQTHFRESSEYIRCRYRRKMGDSFRWVSMELIPSIEYTHDNQIVMLYIQDIHDSYISELHYQKELEYYCNYDILTGLRNRFYYKNFCSAYLKTAPHLLGILFADINGLKYVNDHYGHEKGDELILKFSSLLSEHFDSNFCCRISGDEFLVLFDSIEEQDLAKRTEAFHQLLWMDATPIASVGFAWNRHAPNVEAVVKEAEAAMYIDKQRYYQKFPEYGRT